ncbi:hypothetical protein AOXY_G7363 [Acipenser oxyrinchus oxyrinchus]|uniref:Uncharacterized protein n=1 Tax=Acipenser oxyrinchus oxyrinchus TaxID=40147 RepID=A0AAD8G9Z3_ACIOX|nr:hypothetical protein AOXY_G7363 [Acipenser oxyrinchus oxyrinchus]
MMEQVSGVSALLKKEDCYPNLVIWHCYNHRLELAVGDALKEQVPRPGVLDWPPVISDQRYRIRDGEKPAPGFDRACLCGATL